MDLKERLERLTAIGKREDRARSQVLEELRERLEGFFLKKIHEKRRIIPLENLVKGEVVSSEEGETFQVTESFPPDFRVGEMLISDLLSIPTYPAHLLSGDDRLKELDLRKTLFLDTETTGLTGGTGTVAFLVGMGYIEGDSFRIRQLFMRDLSEERATLELLNHFLDRFDFLVTFNGKYYDIPLLETRYVISRKATKIGEIPNFDLLFPSRKIWKGVFENCRLLTLESRLVGIERGDDVPSEWIPSLYFDYLRSRDASRIKCVFYHNRMDILAMVGLAARINLTYHDPRAARPDKGVEHLALGKLFWSHGSIEKAIHCFETALKRCDDTHAWEAMKWLSLCLKKIGQGDRARLIWEEMVNWNFADDIFPLVELAKYHEHRRKDPEKALFYVKKALGKITPIGGREFNLLIHRLERLKRKLGISNLEGLK